ncbi:MAG: hypothetical protein ABJN34_12910 [Litoreibacter sp.]|uniref:hypothetical protein n=1 Tax=Litoreibacter sp. TaxID=1969459 RepID=UPI00329A2B0B
MKNVILALGIAAGLMAAPALALTPDAANPADVETLSDTQTDALIAVLSGLPRL